MRCNIIGNKVIVALSRRNLEQLLERLDKNHRDKAIARNSHNLELLVHAEEDDEHYKSGRKSQGVQ